jgi:hypothetical protein
MDHSTVPVRSMAEAYSTQVQARSMALAAGSMARNKTT